MGMVSFHELFRKRALVLMPGAVAERATRSVIVTLDDGRLPKDEYGFTEWYCVDPECDCRRALVKVIVFRQIASQNDSVEYVNMGLMLGFVSSRTHVMCDARPPAVLRRWRRLRRHPIPMECRLFDDGCAPRTLATRLRTRFDQRR